MGTIPKRTANGNKQDQDDPPDNAQKGAENGPQGVGDEAEGSDAAEATDATTGQETGDMAPPAPFAPNPDMLPPPNPAIAPFAKMPPNEKAAALLQSYADGARFVFQERMTLAFASQDISNHFGISMDIVVEEINARTAKMREEEEAESKDLVAVFVPRSFNIQTPAGSVKVKQGTQRLERRYAEHWYAKDNGVQII